MGFNWSMSDWKILLISWILLSILASLHITVAWLVSIRLLIYNYSNALSKPSETVPSTAITNGILPPSGSTISLVHWQGLSTDLIFYFFESFSLQHQLMVFHLSLSDNKSPQVSGAPLSNLSDLNNAVGLHFSSYFPVFQILHQIFGDFAEHTNNDWYHCYFHEP